MYSFKTADIPTSRIASLKAYACKSVMMIHSSVYILHEISQISKASPPTDITKCDRLWENRAQRGVRNIEKR